MIADEKNFERETKILNQYYYYYMVSLYYLINEYGCKWKFLNINEKTFLNGTNLRFDAFERNKYLKEYENNKIGLAEDILTKGMYFPYFIYGLENEQPDENTIRLALGKHRLYSKLLYQIKNETLIEKKFLFIYVPNELSLLKNIYPKNPNYHFYTLKEDSAIIRDHYFTESKKLMKFFDLTGGFLSNLLLDSSIKTNPILNDPILFEKFINSPLDSDNILFQIYQNEKDSLLT